MFPWDKPSSLSRPSSSVTSTRKPALISPAGALPIVMWANLTRVGVSGQVSASPHSTGSEQPAGRGVSELGALVGKGSHRD